MAQMQDTMNELHLPQNSVDERWAAFYIAAQQKYADAPNNEERFQANWYRELNRWMNLTLEELDLILHEAELISKNKTLYEWSCFIRYLLYDTKIVEQDEEILKKLTPPATLQSKHDLFMLVTTLTGADVALYKYQGANYDPQLIEDIFSLVGQALRTRIKAGTRWAMPVYEFLPCMAKAKLLCFNDLGFEITTSDLPGKVYRHRRSGEVVMVAAGGQLYNKWGKRLNPVQEQRLLLRVQEMNPLIADTQLPSETDPDVESIKTLNLLPEDIWETKFYMTESGGFVGHTLSEGTANPNIRLFEAEYWEEVLSEQSRILRLMVVDSEMAKLENLQEACWKALTYCQKHEEDVKAIVLESWLLDPQFLQRLSGTDPLVDFAGEFKLFPISSEPEQATLQIFGFDIHHFPQNLWPEDTEYQRVVKRMAREGMIISLSGGLILADQALTLYKTEAVKKEQ